MSAKSLLGKSTVMAVIAALAAVLIFITKGKELEISSGTVMPVKTVVAEKGDIQKLLRISGFIESDSMVTVLPRIGGTLTELYLEMGDSVEKDQIIGLIDREPFQLAFNQAEAAYRSAESTFKRISSLYETNSISRQNYDEAKANSDALKSFYELAELNLSYTTLKSPVSGVVLEKHVSRGAMVAPQVPVITIGDIYNLKVNSGIPEIHYSFFVKNRDKMSVLLSVPALGNRQFSGRIRNIAPFISPQTRNFSVKCQVDDVLSELRPGMFTYLDFVLEERRDIFYLPYKTLSGGNELWFVHGEGKVGMIEFSPEFGNELYFQIPENLADKQFIIEGQSFLKVGSAIR